MVEARREKNAGVHVKLPRPVRLLREKRLEVAGRLRATDCKMGELYDTKRLVVGRPAGKLAKTRRYLLL